MKGRPAIRPQGGQGHAEAHAIDLFAPLRLSLLWLIGTYVGFLSLGEVEEVDNLFWLTVAVGAFIASFAFGYWVRARRYSVHASPNCGHESADGQRHVRTLVAIGGLYYAAYGFAYMREYGVASIGAVVNALSDPGGAYLAKFQVFERQEAMGQVNPAVQIITLAAVLATPLVPFLIVYWRSITWDLKALAFVGIGLYASFFLSIGTLAGLGQTVIYVGVSLLVVRGRRGAHRTRHRRGMTVLGVVLAIGFVAYMAYNQGARLDELGSGVASRYDPNPLVESVTSDQFARGITVTFSYPTHGYQGLAYNLETPFVWTRGQGASRALDSYLDQYGLADSVAQETYPARTELRTGWPAGQLWATVYPWLASDLSWFGVPIAMFVVGWWTARWWYETMAQRSRLALLLLCQAGVFIAFVPANNQIGLSRPNLIAVTTLLGIYILKFLNIRFLERRIRRDAGPRLVGARNGGWGSVDEESSTRDGR